MLVYLHTGEDIKILLKDQFPKCSSARISDPKTNFQFDISVTSRWLGIDTGKSILLNVSEQLNNIRKYMEEVTRKPNPVELEKILQIVCEKGDL